MQFQAIASDHFIFDFTANSVHNIKAVNDANMLADFWCVFAVLQSKAPCSLVKPRYRAGLPPPPEHSIPVKLTP